MLVLCVALVSGCASERQLRISAGVGFGLVALGGGIMLQSTGGPEDEPIGTREKVGRGLLVGGGFTLLVTIVSFFYAAAGQALPRQ